METFIQLDQLMSTGVGCGPYQILVLLLIFLFSFIAIDGIIINFMAGKMDFQCARETDIGSSNPVDTLLSYSISLRSNSSHNITGSLNGRDTSLTLGSNLSDNRILCECNSWKYDRSLYVSNIISEYDLVCQKAWLVDLVSTSYMTGRLFSCLIHGYLSDKFGRKKVLVGSHIIKLVGGVMSLYSPNYPVFAFSRFIIAFGSTASCMASFVLLVESTGQQWRRKFGVMFNVSVAIGGMLLPLVAYIVRDFRHLQAIYTWPQFILLLCFGILDESPRWLVSQGKSKEAFKVVQKMAVVNNKEHLITKNDFLIEKKILEMKEKVIKFRKSFKEKICSSRFFENKLLALKTAILWFSWFVSALIYYAISLNIGRLPGNVFLNTFLVTLVEIPANFVTILCIEKFGGRLTLAVFNISAAVSCYLMIPFMFCEDCGYAVTAFGILGRGMITVSYNALYVETAETYPTNIRSQALGVSASFGRLSSMASSFLGGIMTDVWRPLPSIIFGSMALISGVLFFVFPKASTGDLQQDITSNGVPLDREKEILPTKRSSAELKH